MWEKKRADKIHKKKLENMFNSCMKKRKLKKPFPNNLHKHRQIQKHFVSVVIWNKATDFIDGHKKVSSLFYIQKVPFLNDANYSLWVESIQFAVSHCFYPSMKPVLREKIWSICTMLICSRPKIPTAQSFQKCSKFGINISELSSAPIRP